MQRTDEISTRDAALAAVKKDGKALDTVEPKLKNNISFAWAVSRIQSETDDEIRKKYLNRFFIQEGLKLFVSIATVTISSLFIAGVVVLPIASLAVLIVGSLLASISGLYATNKIYQHAQGILKSKSSESQTQDLDALSSLPNEMILEIRQYLAPSDTANLARVSKRMYTLFQPPNRVLNKFLERVAFGMQDKVEQLFNDVYKKDAAKIQEALRYNGRFTDYSGRTFNCTAYEYAYWAKDTHMCRMLECYMDDETKAFLLARIGANDANGLTYQQNGTEHCSAHFDFTPLIDAYQRYLNGYDAWFAARNWGAIDDAWLKIGKAQRDVPAHVAQEYCRPDRSFNPTPEFHDARLPRDLTFYNWAGLRIEAAWFPLVEPDRGLGFDFAAVRGGWATAFWVDAAGRARERDLAAITRLNEVRTADLTLSRENLKPSAPSHGFSS